MVGRAVQVRVARNNADTIIGERKGSLLPVAAWEEIDDLEKLWFIHEEDEKENLQKILEASRKLFEAGGELAQPAQPSPQVGFTANPTP